MIEISHKSCRTEVLLLLVEFCNNDKKRYNFSVICAAINSIDYIKIRVCYGNVMIKFKLFNHLTIMYFSLIKYFG